MVKIDLFVFNRAPEPLYKDIIEYSAPAIHTNLDAALFQTSGKLQACKLNTLIGIENFRF